MPTLIGSLVGLGRKKRWGWVLAVTGTSPEPRSWDYLWSRPGLKAVVRLKLKSGVWVAGYYGAFDEVPTSYASGYPEPADLYLGMQVAVDAASGEFVVDAEGRISPVVGRTSLLLRWDEVEYADILEVS